MGELRGALHALDYALVIVWMVLEFALFAGLFSRLGLIAESNFHPAVMFFFGIAVTQFFWHWEMGFVTFLHHFHPDVAWYREFEAPPAAERQLISTVHVKFPAGFNWGLFNILEHTAHHISPQIPLYQLANAQAALKKAYPEHVTQEKFSLVTVWKIFATCKCWDPIGKRWVGYSQ